MLKRNLIVLFSPDSFRYGKKIPRIPFSLLFLERMVRDLPVETVIISEVLQPDYEDYLIKLKDRIFLAGVTSMTGFQIAGGIAFSELVKKHTGSPVVWGGWHTTLMSEQVLQNSYIDFIVKGQGEVTFRELVQALLNGTSFENIEGLGFKTKDGIKINNEGIFQNPFTFPEIDFSKIEIEKYIFRSRYADKCLSFFCSLGCPYNCGFCSVALVYKRKWYHNDVDRLISSLEFLIEKTGINGLKIEDDNFFVNRTFVISFCKELINRNLKLEWYGQGHASHILKTYSDEDVQLFKKAGARMISIGAESGDQDILDLIDKKNLVQDNIKCLQLFTRNEIDSFYTTMVGFPIDPYEDFSETIAMLMEAKYFDPRFKAMLSFYTPYPGTKLYEISLENGFVPPASLAEWANHTFKKNRAPWLGKKIYISAEYFMNFYFPLADFNLYKMAPGKTKFFVLLISLMTYPLIRLRFKYKFLKFPFEAFIFLKILDIINAVFKTNFKFRYNQEGYLK